MGCVRRQKNLFKSLNDFSEFDVFYFLSENTDGKISNQEVPSLWTLCLWGRVCTLLSPAVNIFLPDLTWNKQLGLRKNIS